MTSNRLLNAAPDEKVNGAVVSLFGLGREKTAGEFIALFMIGDALTTEPLSGARFVSAGAFFFVLVDSALRHVPLHLPYSYVYLPVSGTVELAEIYPLPGPKDKPAGLHEDRQPRSRLIE